MQKLKAVGDWFEAQAAAADDRVHRDGLSAAEAEKTWLAYQTRYDASLAIHSFIGFCEDFLTFYQRDFPTLIPRRTNQDALENLFGQFRSLGRANTNPTVLAYAQRIQSLIITSQHKQKTHRQHHSF